MLLRTFVDVTLAQNSYLLGCEQTHQAVVIDPARDVQVYIDAAARAGMQITWVAETHIHADFVSGLRELSARTGAHMAVSGMGSPAWTYAFATEVARILHDGDALAIGTIRLDALHTPGHSPEHLCFLVTDHSRSSQPMALLSGDCLFVGDVGRPDLLESAAGVHGAAAHGADDQFASVQRLKLLPDYLMVLPGHGAGSACGKALANVPTSTLGIERRFNPAFQFTEPNAFADWLMTGQPETPRYFAQMKRINREGPVLLDSLSEPGPLEGFILEDALRHGIVIDARSGDRFNAAHVPGAINIPAGDSFGTYAGWIVDYAAPTYLIADADAVHGLTRQLRAIGADGLAGYFPAGEVERTSDSLRVADLREALTLMENGALTLDVRSSAEFEEAAVEGALHAFYGRLPEMTAELPGDVPVMVYCATGIRSQIAASLLERAGFRHVVILQGGFDAWRSAGLPIRSAQETFTPVRS
jgi:hydroxyacylglutathione hydrolase